MKKKGNKKPDAKKDEKPVDQKDIMAEINQYLKISETENKLKEKEKEKENEEYQKLKTKNDELIKDLQMLKEKENLVGLYDTSLEILIQTADKESKIHLVKLKNDSLTKEVSAVNTSMLNANINLAELEKVNKLSLQRLQALNEEKKKLIQDEKNKFNEINQKCENFVKDFKSKIEGSVPDKETLVSENENLKAQLEEAISNANKLKESLENQMKEKEVKTQTIEEELRSDIKKKMEDISYTNQKIMIENMELKNQNLLYAKKFEEVNRSISQSNEIFAKMKEEIQKRNTKINQYERDNSELKNKEKINDSKILEFHLDFQNLKTENEKTLKEMTDLSITVKSLTEKLNLMKNSNTSQSINVLQNNPLKDNI